MNATQRAQIPALLKRRVEAYEFRGQVWTCMQVAEVIRRTFRVIYHVTTHPAHASRLLHTLRESDQRPRSRAAQRDEAAIAVWWRERWSALETKPPTKGGLSSR